MSRDKQIEEMAEKTPLEMLEEVKEALDFQMIVLTATEATSVSITKEHAYICLIAIEKMISKYTEGDNERQTNA